MAKRKPTKARTFQNKTICLNEVLNPNLRFIFLYSQNLFEEYKVIVDNFAFKTTKLSKSKPIICLWKNRFGLSSTSSKPSKLAY